MSTNLPRSLRVLGGPLAVAVLLLSAGTLRAQTLEPVDVEGQPLAANVTRLLQALDLRGCRRWPRSKRQALEAAAKARDAAKLQELLDPHVLLVGHASIPKSRVKAARGPATPALQQGGYTPVLVKVHQREHGHEAAAHHQPAGAADLRPAASRARSRPATSRTASSTSRCSPSPPMTDEAERPEGRVRPRPDLQQRGRQARGDVCASTSARGRRTSASAARCRCCSTCGPPSR